VHHYNTVTQRQFFLYPPSSRLTSHLRCGQVEVRGGTKFGRNPPTTVRQMLENIVNCPIFETGNVILDPNPESHQRQKLIISRRSSIAEVRRTTGCSLLSHLVTNKTSAALRPYCLQFTSQGPPPSPCSVYPTSTARLEATSRKT